MIFMTPIRLLLVFVLLFSSLSIAKPPYNSVAILGMLPVKENNTLNQKLAPGLGAAARSLQGMPYVYFHISKPDQYHVSLSILESTKSGTKLTKDDLKRIKKLTYQKINIKKGYKGNFYGLYAFVHGFDAKGQVIHAHYKNPADMNTLLTKGTDKTFKRGSIITHAHFVARYGTNLSAGPKKTPGQLKVDVTKFLDKVKAKRKKWKFHDIYDDRGDFTAHLTVAVLKNHIGKNVTKQNPLSPATVIGTYQKIYGSFDAWKRQQGRANKNDLFTLKEFELSGEKTLLNGKRDFEKTRLH